MQIATLPQLAAPGKDKAETLPDVEAASLFTELTATLTDKVAVEGKGSAGMAEKPATVLIPRGKAPVAMALGKPSDTQAPPPASVDVSITLAAEPSKAETISTKRTAPQALQETAQPPAQPKPTEAPLPAPKPAAPAPETGTETGQKRILRGSPIQGSSPPNKERPTERTSLPIDRAATAEKRSRAPSAPPQTAELSISAAPNRHQGTVVSASAPGTEAAQAPDRPLTAPSDGIAIQTSEPAQTVRSDPAALAAPAKAQQPAPAATEAVAQIKEAIEGRGSARRIEIRLDPPELGRVQIDFEIGRQGSLRAVVTAAEPETLDLLRRNSALLSDDLRESGFGDIDLSWKGGEQDAEGSQKKPFHTQPSAYGRQDAATPVTTTGHEGLIDLSL